MHYLRLRVPQVTERPALEPGERQQSAMQRQGCKCRSQGNEAHRGEGPAQPALPSNDGGGFVRDQERDAATPAEMLRERQRLMLGAGKIGRQEEQGYMLHRLPGLPYHSLHRIVQTQRAAGS